MPLGDGPMMTESAKQCTCPDDDCSPGCTACEGLDPEVQCLRQWAAMQDE
jgi:hypothetical protein